MTAPPITFEASVTQMTTEFLRNLLAELNTKPLDTPRSKKLRAVVVRELDRRGE